MRSLLLLLLAASSLHARPPYRKALVDLVGLPAASRLNDCATCHLPARRDEERAHNAFGARLKALRAEHRKAGKPLDIETRLLAVADEDSDGDGEPNLLELLAGTFPGDPADKPAAEALALARTKKAALLASLAGYRWRPFARPERPVPPTILKAMRNPVDAFLEEQRAKRGLAAQGEAPRAVLLRRATLDLTGLPPTSEELSAFLADASPLAYERLVDRLLASPAYGERWGRHWMDVWRYSDWAGFGAQVRDSQPHVWHWRDWIVESLNAGKGYDRMAQEMLAADELAPADPSALRATGYLVRNYKLLSREKWMQDAVDHTSMAFLGMTLGCARCHDHMYEAVTQREYFQVRAIFAPHDVRTDRVPGIADPKKGGLPRAYDARLDAKTFLLDRGDDRSPGKEDLAPGVPALLGGALDVKPVALPPEASDPDGRAFVKRDELREAEESVAKAKGAEAELARAKLEALRAVLLAEESKDAESGKRATQAQRQAALLEARRAALASKTPAAKAALAKAEAALKMPPSEKYAPRPRKTYPATSTGRRLAFAKWLTSRDNPLAARVAVNHVWARHFGAGLVPGMFDFGKNAPPATHPALLDWLAVEFMESGWDLKRLHRLLMTSAAYRADSRPLASSVARDPDNVWLWRFAPRRLEAEAVRDLVLSAGGRLDRAMGGPDLPHAAGLVSERRSVYYQSAQEKQMEFLLLFDCASVTESYLRKQAVMPQQALALANSEFALANARLAAQRLAGTDAVFIEAAFRAMLTRPPAAQEAAECAAFLSGEGKRLGAPRARGNLLHVLMNHHEFVTVR